MNRMQESAVSCKQTIAVLSEEYLASGFASAEWQAAFATDPTGSNKALIPVRIGRCNTNGLMGQVIRIDLLDVDEETAKKRLLDGLRGRMKPGSKPHFPATNSPVFRADQTYVC